MRGPQIGWTEKKQQVPFDFARAGSPLRFAPVGMTILWGRWVEKENRRSLGFARDDNKGAVERCGSPLKPTPGLTPISCHAVLERSACAPFIKERRMECINAISFHRESGQWGTQFLLPVRQKEIKSYARGNLLQSPALSLASRALVACERFQLPRSWLKRSKRRRALCRQSAGRA